MAHGAGNALAEPAHERPRGVQSRLMRAVILALAAGALAVPTRPLAAQAAPAGAAEPSVCLGFAFGAFTPKLDWAKAGHAPIHDSSSIQRAPAGRDWASDQAMPNDSSLYLFPSWWPVGVLIELATRKPAPGDTVAGRATALVARGNITPPTAKVKAWRVPCGRSAPPAPSAAPAPKPDSGQQRARQHPRK
jgi:hypothetical protein